MVMAVRIPFSDPPRLLTGVLLLALAVAPAAVLGAGAAAPPGEAVPALLAERCGGCHFGENPKGGLRLDSREGVLAGGTGGPAVHPGDAAVGTLLRRVTSRDLRAVMPPGKPLDPAEVARLREWVKAGAPWTRAPDPPAPAGPHWAFVPPRRPPVPAVRRQDWVRNPVDAFVLARLEAAGLSPSAPAGKRELLRRVSFDLTGLPPTPEECAAFLADGRPDAYERAVRRLLASPAYGERWAQHWLDVARFGETNGFELDADRPQAWRYRDWVVRALAADMPYDQFLRLQIAGDLMAPADPDARTAVHFLRAGPQHVVGGNVDPVELRQEWLNEAVTGVGAGVLGLTVQCARCHDHKFDPISQPEYFQLQSFFAGTLAHEFPHGTPEEGRRYQEAAAAHQAKITPLKGQIAEIERPYQDRLRAEKLAHLPQHYRDVLAIPSRSRTDAQRRLAAEAEVGLRIEWIELVAALSPEDRARRAELRRQVHDLERRAPAPPALIPSVGEMATPQPTHVLLRGEVGRRGQMVQPAFPAALGAAGRPALEGPRRLALAEWLAAPNHPLTARVLVNRLWQHHFGRGLVATPNDFGQNGRRPTHPELLDWLAVELREPTVSLPDAPAGGPWSLKRLHYLLATSNAYRQASSPDPGRAARDPQNALLWRQNLRRLDAEAVRDSVLAVAGTLNLEGGGPPVRVPLEKEVYDTIFTEYEPDNLWPVTPDEKQHTRRSLYLLRKRNVRLPLLAVFDQPDMMSPCAERGRSVHALQALTLLNSDFMVGQARALAARLFREHPADGTARLNRLWQLALARPPSPREAALARGLLADQARAIRARVAAGQPVERLPGAAAGKVEEQAAWVDLCLGVFNLNDFVYVR
jgi:hypothetical protein